MFFDITAGERARRIRVHPEEEEFVPDPTDPRAEEPLAGKSDPGTVLDPTDPRNGQAA
jgi:hypothetical protein